MTTDSCRATRIAFLLVLVSATTFCFWKARRLRKQRQSRLLSSSNNKPNPKPNPNVWDKNGKIFFFSETGTSKTLSLRLSHLLASHNLPFQVLDPSLYEPEDLPSESFILVIASTWVDGKPPPNGLFLSRWLSDSASDFRVGSLLLSSCKFAVFGVGSRSYGPTFNVVAKDFSCQMLALGASEILPVCQGDVDGGDIDVIFDHWSRRLVDVFKRYSGGEDGERLIGSRLDEDDSFGGSEEDDDDNVNDSEGVLVDLEDIAGKGPSRSSSVKPSKFRSGKFTLVSSANGEENAEKEMVTPIIRTSLEKQGTVALDVFEVWRGYAIFLSFHYSIGPPHPCHALIQDIVSYVGSKADTLVKVGVTEIIQPFYSLGLRPYSDAIYFP